VAWAGQSIKQKVVVVYTRAQNGVSQPKKGGVKKALGRGSGVKKEGTNDL